MVLKSCLRALVKMGYQCTFGIMQAGQLNPWQGGPPHRNVTSPLWENTCFFLLYSFPSITFFSSRLQSSVNTVEALLLSLKALAAGSYISKAQCVSAKPVHGDPCSTLHTQRIYPDSLASSLSGVGLGLSLPSTFLQTAQLPLVKRIQIKLRSHNISLTTICPVPRHTSC